MKHITSYILLIFGLVACSGIENNRDITPEALLYVERFELLLGDNITYPVVMGVLKEPLAGTCSYSATFKLVTLDTIKWVNYTEAQKEQLIFHELGHCSLKRKHSDVSLPDSWPLSVMRSFMFNNEESMHYLKHKEAYALELFQTNEENTFSLTEKQEDADFILIRKRDI